MGPISQVIGRLEWTRTQKTANANQEANASTNDFLNEKADVQRNQPSLPPQPPPSKASRLATFFRRSVPRAAQRPSVVSHGAGLPNYLAAEGKREAALRECGLIPPLAQEIGEKEQDVGSFRSWSSTATSSTLRPSFDSSNLLPSVTLTPPGVSSAPRLRQPVSPTIHTLGSIYLLTQEIEDEESRRLTELAFLL